MSFATGENMPPIGQGLFNAMRMMLPVGGTVLELGSGEGSTVELKKAGYNVWSIEHNNNYVGRWNDAEHTIYAPFNETGFYDLASVKDKLGLKYDILLVDGPDTENRVIRFYEHGIDYFDQTVPWFFDDWYGDMSIGIKAVAKKTGRTLLVFEDKYKQYAVLLPVGK